uniref:Uncharacterized protein n=1 Tax=Pithovirus LCPAC302 TaxID=2506593 RepID=A0A481Z721_9VIRU|nr:MAG: hypothetical protein LCPAC302_00360 [Pithovirus LCPAC302]
MIKPDVEEVKLLIDNLQFIEKQLPRAIGNWKNKIKSCDWAVIGDNIDGILKSICQNPVTIGKIFAPLYSFLNNYIANREGRIAFTGRELNAFLKRGLTAIYRYTVMSDFFAKNPHFFVPSVSPITQFSAYKKAQTQQNTYKDFMLTLNERLIGCKQKLNFLFLGLVGTVKQLNPELEKMRLYLDNSCNSIRIARLGIK